MRGASGRHETLEGAVYFHTGNRAIVTGYGLHNHIVNVRAARLDHIAAPAAYFPPGAIWTQDISHAPLDPQSSTIIAWLADAGGWGFGKMNVDFSLRVLQADASTPRVPFREAPGFGTADSDKISTIPFLPAAASRGYRTIRALLQKATATLSWFDRNQGKLYEVYQANYADGALFGTRQRCMEPQPRLSSFRARRSMLQHRRRRLTDCSTALQRRRTRSRKNQPRHSFYSSPIHGFERTFLCIQLRTPALRSGPLPLRPWALTSASSLLRHVAT